MVVRGIDYFDWWLLMMVNNHHGLLLAVNVRYKYRTIVVDKQDKQWITMGSPQSIMEDPAAAVRKASQFY